MQKNFPAFVQSESELNFYARFRNGLHTKGFRLVLLSNRPSLFLQSKLYNIPCALVKNGEEGIEDFKVSSTTEVLSRKVNEQAASRYYHGVLQALGRLHKVDGISVMFIWNGNTISAKAMSNFALKYEIPTLFAEHTNLPKKLFIDPRGVHAQSLLFHKAELLQRYTEPEGQFDQWRERYLQYRRDEKNDINELQLHDKKGVLSFIDNAASRFIDIPLVDDNNKDQGHGSAAHITFDEYDVQKGKYNFFPVQLSSESAVLFDNSVTVHDAIGIAYEKSREQQCDLLIKPHLQETRMDILDTLATLRKEAGLYIVNTPAFHLVEHCNEVITVNSPAGLDGLLMGKKVTFLGATCLSNMDGAHLRKYLLCYLIDVDFFGKENISVKTVETILSRLLLR